MSPAPAPLAALLGTQEGSPEELTPWAACWWLRHPEQPREFDARSGPGALPRSGDTLGHLVKNATVTFLSPTHVPFG